MALSTISDAYAAAASVALPSFAAGDLAVAFAYRSGSTAPPTVPTGWTTIANSTGANTNSRAIGWRVLQAGDTTTGTWTNATAIAVIVLRGQAASPIGASASGGTNTTTLTTPALTLQVTDGSSWVIAFAGSKSTNANTVTLSGTTDEGSTQGALNVATGRGVASWASRNYSAAVNTSANRTDAVEIKPGPVTGPAAQVGLSPPPLGTPATTSGYTLHARALVTTSAQATLRANLWEGATDRSGVLETGALTTGFAEYTLSISDANAAAIVNYSNLSVTFWGYSSSGATPTVEVADLWLSVPQGRSVSLVLPNRYQRHALLRM